MIVLRGLRVTELSARTAFCEVDSPTRVHDLASSAKSGGIRQSISCPKTDDRPIPGLSLFLLTGVTALRIIKITISDRKGNHCSQAHLEIIAKNPAQRPSKDILLAFYPSSARARLHSRVASEQDPLPSSSITNPLTEGGREATRARNPPPKTPRSWRPLLSTWTRHTSSLEPLCHAAEKSKCM